MNNLIYGNQQPDKIAAGVEEIVRKDVGAAEPIVYRIAAGDANRPVDAVIVGILDSLRHDGQMTYKK